MLGLAARDRGCDRSLGDAAVDAITDERQPPRSEMAFFELPDELRDEPFQRLARSLGMCCRFLKPKRCTRRQFRSHRCQRFRLIAEHSVERFHHVFAASEAPREREPRNAGESADGFKTQPLERAYRIRIEPQSGYVQWRQLILEVVAADAGSMMRQRPSRRSGRGNCETGGE